MNWHNYKHQTAGGKLILLITYPIILPFHIHEWRERRRLQRIIRKGLPEACRDPKSVAAEIVDKASWELRFLYGK